VINSRTLAKKYGLKMDPSDSRILAKILDREAGRLGSMSRALVKVSGQIAGTINLAVVTKIKDRLMVNIVSNNGSVYVGRQGDDVLFASEKYFLRKIADKFRLKMEISQIVPGTGVEICPSGSFKKYYLKATIVSDERTILLKVPKSLKEHHLDPRAIKIKRCVRCILPLTTPYISFDKDGVCNYCREHQKIEYGNTLKLKQLLKRYKKTGGEPDCIIAFSGGRDSAYGLYYLVKELGMHPVAVTFDWGMISDIGRRNQARMLGKLGIEQIIVSADLDKVRADIRMNLRAWLRKPDLGMVPILMQADKVTEYHVDKIQKELGVKLIFFCRGNELEREEFKAGYCGVRNADPGGVIHNYSVADKLRLLVYYLKGFLINPYYLNSSLWNSMLGYLITYVVPHDYIYLWHYVKWEEKKIIKTLQAEYGWEDDGETGITWRIDDGSPAFYNYLYGQIQGFTENDSFRSRQIREGLLTRSEAMKVVARENQPRYGALAWYFNKIGMDGSEVLRVIDGVMKKY
jgi:hypothetical protein